MSVARSVGATVEVVRLSPRGRKNRQQRLLPASSIAPFRKFEKKRAKNRGRESPILCYPFSSYVCTIVFFLFLFFFFAVALLGCFRTRFFLLLPTTVERPKDRRFCQKLLLSTSSLSLSSEATRDKQQTPGRFLAGSIYGTTLHVGKRVLCCYPVSFCANRRRWQYIYTGRLRSEAWRGQRTDNVR